MALSEGDKVIIALIGGGAFASSLFSMWIINQGIATDKALDYITEVVTDLRTMKRQEDAWKGGN